MEINVDSLFEEKYNVNSSTNNQTGGAQGELDLKFSSTPLNFTSNMNTNQNFNYDLVNQTLNQKKKDHFDFVNDLLKKK